MTGAAAVKRGALLPSILVLGSVTLASPPARPPRELLSRPLPASHLRVGRVELAACDGLPAYCGTLERPLDPAGEGSGAIGIHYELYPRRDATLPALGTIVATEGGPGYATSESRLSYLDLFWPLLDHRDLLLVDNRGTGESEPLDCPSIQSSPFLDPPGIRACGERLGRAADLFGSGLAADDLDAVLDVLGIDRVDLYGDSYGTFFAQTFAGRHPGRLRSIVLDGAYPVVGQSPFYQESATALRRAVESVCARSPSCPGGAEARLDALLGDLRAHPFEGEARDGDGKLRAVKADAAQLAFLVFSNASGPVLYREMDAAARAHLEDGDSGPLLRLFAENQLASRSGGPPFRPRDYSAGLFVAVSCSDYPFVYDLTKPPEARTAERDAAIARARLDPALYAPFTVDEYAAMPLDYSVLDTCLTWPAPSLAHPPGQPVPPGTVFPAVPALVLSGSLDTLTPAEQGAAAAKLFPLGHQVLVENSFHVTALGEQDRCASEIVRRFVETLDPGDTSCADRIAEVRMVPRFARLASDLPAASPAGGNEGTESDRKLATAAALTVGDALSRWWVNLSGSAAGLRGGSVRYGWSRGLYTARVASSRFVEDVEVSGRVTWDWVTPGRVAARVRLRGPGGVTGRLDVSWNDREPHALAAISGTIGGRRILATTYAP